MNHTISIFILLVLMTGCKTSGLVNIPLDSVANRIMSDPGVQLALSNTAGAAWAASNSAERISASVASNATVATKTVKDASSAILKRLAIGLTVLLLIFVPYAISNTYSIQEHFSLLCGRLYRSLKWRWRHWRGKEW